MIEKIFEDTYSKYSSTYKLKALCEYYSKLPKTSTTKYVKFLRFSGDTASIYNVSQILISPNVAEGGDGMKKIHIEYTGDEKSKVMDIATFASQCKKIFQKLKKDDPENVEVLAVLEGTDKPTKFRFYFDSDNDFAILVNGTNTKGLETFLENYEGDLAAAVSVPKSTKAPKTAKLKIARGKKSKAVDKHEGYVLVDATKEFGHTVRIWKKDTSDDQNAEKKEVKSEDEINEWLGSRPGKYNSRGQYEPTAADMAAWRNTHDEQYQKQRQFEKSITSLPSDKKDKALVAIVQIMIEHLKAANNADAKKTITAIAKTLEDNKIDPKHF